MRCPHCGRDFEIDSNERTPASRPQSRAPVIPAPRLRDASTDETAITPSNGVAVLDAEHPSRAANQLPDADVTLIRADKKAIDEDETGFAMPAGVASATDITHASPLAPAPSLTPHPARVRHPTPVGRTTLQRAAATGPLEIGEPFGERYHIIRLLGIGGMGAVYQAWDAELEVALALKVVRPDVTEDPHVAEEIERRFKRELLLARQVTHPNVVRIHDLGEIDGIKYITMPYIEGKDLSDILAETGTLPVARALHIARQVAGGLAAAHAAGVVHRDLKPANIMIDAEDNAQIMDFGIARAAGGHPHKGDAATFALASGDSGATRVGTVVGTLEYMAPEQARGEAVDQRADIYAFGLIFHRMLVGKRLAEGATDAFTDLKARMEHEPIKVREVSPDIPEHVEAIVSRCLQPNADARFQTSEELVQAIDRLDENGIPLPEPPPLWKSPRFWATATAVMLSLVVVTWWFAQQFVPEIEKPHEPVSVLVADFANTTGDAMFTGLLEQSLGVGVEGASFITAYDRRTALRVATQLNAGKALDDNVARLVAQREGIKVVLTGSIAGAPTGYQLTVRGINPADGKAILVGEMHAADKNGVLNAIGRLAAEVRKSLGDTKRTGAPGANEMLSAASLEAVAEYIKGQELTRQTRDEEAIAYFKRATVLDPNFGRAYSAWGTAAFKIGRQQEAEAQYKKALSLLDRMTERERYRTLGVYYLAGSKNYDKAIENFSTLVKLYPSDAAAYNNLAVAYTNKLDFPHASEMGRKALEIYPKNRMYRSNYALYAMYAGDFKTATTEANKLLAEDPKYFMGYLPLAMASLDRGDADAARGFYGKMAEVNSRAASLATIGLADLAIVEGRYRDAIDLLTKGIADDEKNAYKTAAVEKRIVLSEAREAEGTVRAALAAASLALTDSQAESVLVPAAAVFVHARRQHEVDDIARALANQFEPQKRAYGRIVDALDYMARQRYVDAVDSLKEAIKFADLWLARFYLGVAYETAGRHGEAFAELEICRKRRGEATALFLDEVPTYRYLAPLPFWLARAQEGLGQNAQARRGYESFLALKNAAPKDPLALDARRRLDTLTTH